MNLVRKDFTMMWGRQWPLLGAILMTLWVVPPLLHQALHRCPVVHPDGVSSAQAMPQWARKYGFDCSVCHTTVPRLTKAGYDFRRAGFRMPDELAQDAKFTGLKDMYAARIREEFRVVGSKTGTAAKGSNTNKFAFHELTFYPISGAFGKYWAAESELTFAPDEITEVENAYVRGTLPFWNDGLLTARAGIFHPFEGYGGSDRPISNIRPSFQTSHAKNGAFDTQVQIWNQDQEGLELGVTKKDTTLSLSILNGFNSAQGAANVGDDNNTRDFLLFFNQFILGDRASVNAEYLNGHTGFDFAGGAGSDWINNYQRTAVYANYYVLKDYKLNLLGGYAMGRDHFPVAATRDASGTFDSSGWYGEAESKLHKHLTAGLRYDTFRPTNKVTHNSVNAVTATLAIPINEIKFLIDYQNKVTQSPTANSKKTDTVRLEWMAIF